MMKNYLVRICLLLTACTLLLTACGTEGTKLPDLSTLGKVVAIAREEGSGTRAEFDTMLATNEAAVDAVAEECHRLSCPQHAAAGAGRGQGAEG